MVTVRATTVPDVWLAVATLAGQLILRSPPSLSSKSAFFHTVSGLSLLSILTSVAGL
ncbi:hypothetical protein BN381_80113 [Candidatus Microthrix parvicella RN1]|uniref:Uncharacterized protein n=1 Tax=Candidatus Neomicrothrix parvicella RN1 TaxID=1229780 RepID=R4Z4C6_9ACTN|nr:hypothetical protein BN381_80113 [Candidatus Microthrix parvicella RN1]